MARSWPDGLPARLAGDDTLVMGVLNVTPDSFSDGGRYEDPVSAVAHGRTLIAQGASIVDVGGESTRPGAPRVDEQEELARVVPVVAELAAEDVVVSVDTMRASVAAASVEAGALIVNDVSAGRADEDMGRQSAAHPPGHAAGVHRDALARPQRRDERARRLHGRRPGQCRRARRAPRGAA